jgi:excisionase family DNA binding protein
MNAWLTVQEAAPLLRMSPQGIYSAVREGQLPANAVLKIGRRVRINVKALLTDQKDSMENESETRQDERSPD